MPRVYGFDVNASNKVGFRYSLIQFLPGRILEQGLGDSVPENRRDKVVGQLADYYHRLSCIRFDRIGRLWAGRQSDYRVSIIPQMKRAIKAAHADDEEWATAAWILEQALPSMIVEDHVYGPFPLCHLDLHRGNILVDKDFNITGIIDWSGAQTVPVERFVACPEFATYPGVSAEKNARSEEFRDIFAAAFRARELEALRLVGDDSSNVGTGAPDGLKTEQDMVPSPSLVSDLFGTPTWEIVFRCTYSFHWRAMSDSRLVMRQIFGEAAKFEDFVAYFTHGPVPATVSGRLM